MKTKRHFLNRSKLRDTIILCSIASAYFFDLTTMSTIAGFLLLGAGSFLHFLAKGILIRNVVLCDKGIYGIVRHPYYLSNYLIDTSFCVLSGSPYLLLLYPFLFFWSYGPTLRDEERLLAAKHGNSFVEGVFAIPQVFPDIGSLKGIKEIFRGFSIKRITWKEIGRITRFCSIGFAIMLLQQLGSDALGSLRRLPYPSALGRNEFLYMTLAVTFYAVSIVLIRISMSRHSRGGI